MRVLILMLLMSSCNYEYYCVNGQIYKKTLDKDHELTRLDISDRFECVRRKK